MLQVLIVFLCGPNSPSTPILCLNLPRSVSTASVLSIASSKLLGSSSWSSETRWWWAWRESLSRERWEVWRRCYRLLAQDTPNSSNFKIYLPPLPNGGAPGKPENAGGGAPPIPAAGPYRAISTRSRILGIFRVTYSQANWSSSSSRSRDSSTRRKRGRSAAWRTGS